MSAGDLPDMDGLGPDGLGPDAALAADVALGALSGDLRRDTERRMARDPAFRALVEDWQRDLSPLLDTIPEVAPPAAVWDRIDAATASTAPAPAAAAPAKPSLWNSLPFWRGMAAGAVGLATVALGLLVAQPEPVADTAAGPLLVATLASPEGTALITAAYDPGRGAVILAPARPERDATRSPELWVIDGDQPPRSLGLIDLANPQAHVIPADRLRGLKAGAVLAISIEPLGGSTTGAPTGPVVATGKLAQI